MFAVHVGLLGGLCAGLQALSSTPLPPLRPKRKPEGRCITLRSSSTASPQPAKTQELVNTFESGGNKALVATLLKYPSRGHISVTGSGNNIGYTIVYARKIAMPDGTTKIRLITNTPMNMANSFNTQNVQNTFSGAILDISPSKGKSSGQLIEAAELQYNKQKKLELGLEGARPWTLANISEREK